MTAALIQHLAAMKHSPIGNYGGIPGVTSWLVGMPSSLGLVRLMECSREHHEPIIPHSHRFDFNCLVLAGSVRNIIWRRDKTGDVYHESTLTYAGKPGEYCKERGVSDRWIATTRLYGRGEEYGMHADEVHSIFFSRGAVVLFFEGPQVTESSIILEPVVDGVVVPTFDVKPWAFKRGEVPA